MLFVTVCNVLDDPATPQALVPVDEPAACGNVRQHSPVLAPKQEARRTHCSRAVQVCK